MRTAFLLGLTLFTAALQAQNNPTPFDCQFSATFTAATVTSPSYFNKGPTAPCIAWRLTYHTVNATGVSIHLQGTVNLANGQPDPAGWTDLTPVAPSVNPAIGTAAGTINAYGDYYPWIRVTATTFTGAGQTMSLTVLGYKGTSAGRGGSGGGGVGTGPSLPSVIITSPTTLTAGVNCTVAYPCPVAQGTVVTQQTVSTVATLSGAGTGTAWIWQDATAGWNVSASAAIAVACDAHATCHPAATGYPITGAFLVAHCSAVAGAWTTCSPPDTSWARIDRPLTSSTLTPVVTATGYDLELPSFAGIVALWTTCTSGFLAFDGTCSTPAGGGTVTSTGPPTIHQMPVWTTATNLKGIGPGSAGQPWVSGGGAADPGYGTDFTWNGSHSWVLGASGILDLSAAAATGFKIPVVAGATPTAIGQIAYDSTANTYKGHNGSTPHTFAYTDSNISGTSAGAPWSGLSIPLANLALLTMGAYTTTFQHSATTGANNLWNWTDTASNTGTGYMHYINLASGSAMKPWFAGVNGVGIGVSNAGVLAAVGGGHVNADEAGGSAVGTAANANTAVACSSTNWSKGWTSGDNHCGAIAAADLPADLGTATTGHKLVAPIKCADTSASPTVYTCTTIPTFVPAVGDMLILSAVNQNSGATPTLAVNGGGNVGIYKWGGTAALASGDLQAGSSPVLTFDSNSHWEAQDIGNAPAGGAGNAADCTDTQAAGAITLTPTAGHVWCLGAGTFTSSGAISTAVSNFQIRGTGPATIIQFTGATAGFTFSGTDTLLSSLTMDGNSQATGGPLVTLAGTRNYVRNVTTKNFGTSHPAIYSEASDQAWVDAQVCPAPGIECIIFTGAAATNTTNFKITNGVYTSPGSSPPGSLVEVLQTSTNLIPTGGLVEGNTFLLHGGMALKFYGSQRLEQHRIVNNHVSGTGNSSDCFQFWQFSHNVVSGNTCRDNGFIVGGIALGDAYNNTFSNNSFYFSNAFTNGVIGLVDGSWNIFDGNNIDYGGTNSPFCAMNFGVSSAPFSYNIISHNNIYLSSGYAQVGICLHNQSSQVIQANLITDNIVSGTNQTGQIGVFLDIDTAGTTTLNTIANNSFYEVPVGVSIGTGVANTRFGENTCDTVAACISNAGTTTKINYTGGLPLATWTTPALAVGSSGYCTDCITSSVPTCAGSGGGTMIRMAAALACW